MCIRSKRLAQLWEGPQAKFGKECGAGQLLMLPLHDALRNKGEAGSEKQRIQCGIKGNSWDK